MITKTFYIVLLVLGVSAPCAAQRAIVRFDAGASTFSSIAAQGARSGGSAFLIEAAGGVVGSFAGFALIYSVVEDCESEDLVCDLEHAGVAIAVSTVASAGGVYLAGRLGKTEPSAVGAVLGAIAGAAAGIGIYHLATEELGAAKSDAGAIITYGVTQGIVAALGSRIARAM